MAHEIFSLAPRQAVILGATWTRRMPYHAAAVEIQAVLKSAAAIRYKQDETVRRAATRIQRVFRGLQSRVETWKRFAGQRERQARTEEFIDIFIQSAPAVQGYLRSMLPEKGTVDSLYPEHARQHGADANTSPPHLPPGATRKPLGAAARRAMVQHREVESEYSASMPEKQPTTAGYSSPGISRPNASVESSLESSKTYKAPKKRKPKSKMPPLLRTPLAQSSATKVQAAFRAHKVRFPFFLISIDR